MILTKKRYIFQGSAVAISAQASGLNDDQRNQMRFPGSAALAPDGGCSTSVCPQHSVDMPGLTMSFENASASIEGTLKPDLGRVEASASVSNVQVHNVIIQKVQAAMIAEDPRNHGQLRFKSPLMPELSGVNIGGAELEITLDDVFLSIPTKQALVDEFAHNACFRESFQDRIYRTGKEFPMPFRHAIPEINGFIVTSIVKSIRFKNGMPDGACISGNQVAFRGLGTLYFGELLIAANQRILTMVRMELQGVPETASDALSFAFSADADSSRGVDCGAIDPGKPIIMP